jgi:hypothetical protein
MSCEGQRECLDPGQYCPDNKFCLDDCVSPPVELLFNPGHFIPGIPNVPPVLEEIFNEICPLDTETNVVISSQSGQSFYRTTDPIFNQRFRARLFTFQATMVGTYTITLTNNSFFPFITVSRFAGTFWQNAGTSLSFTITIDQVGPMTLEVTTLLPQTFGSFDVALACPAEDDGSGCTGNVPGGGTLTGTAAYWKCDEASGNALDATGNGLDLVQIISPVGSLSGIIGTSRSFVTPSQPFLFLGPNAPSIDTSLGLTITFWVQFNAFKSSPNPNTGSSPVWYNAFDSGAGTLFSFELRPILSFGIVIFRFIVKGEGGASQTISGPSITLNTWYFVSMVYNKTTGKVCIKINDGSAVLSNPMTFTGTQTNNQMQSLMTFAAQAPDFRIDEIGIWRRRLSEGALTKLYNAGVGLGFPFP